MTTSAPGATPAPDRVRAPEYGYPARAPSGLFPSGPPRPAYREPHPVRGPAVAAGLAATALWMLLFGVLGTSVRSYGWFTLVGGALAWGAALLLARAGDRGVAVGVAISTSIAWAIAWLVIVATWAVRDWPLW